MIAREPRVHKHQHRQRQNVIIADDMLAAGGTAEAVVKQVERLGGGVAGLAFVAELDFLKGRDRFARYDVFSLL